MRNLLRRIKGKILRPKVLRRIVVCGDREPRRKQAVHSGDRARVYLLRNVDRPREALARIEGIWEDHLQALFKPGHRVLIKINLNTSDPYPASTSPEMLAALVDFLHGRGIRNLVVGDCTSAGALPTRKAARLSGILGALDGKAEFVGFDDQRWVNVPIPGRYLQQVTVPESVLDVDRIIFLANLKTHSQADFTCGLKLGVGFMHPLERTIMHRDHLQEKVVEINLAVPPDLVLIDGRVAFVEGGPARGRVERGGVMLLGTDLLAVDVEAYRQLYNLKNSCGCCEHFSADPFAMRQLAHGRSIGVSDGPWSGYHCEEV